MSKNQFTFNDLPEVLGELCDRIASMESLLTEKLSKQNEVKENTHVPMTVQEACAYLKMPLSTFYYKVKKDDIPVINKASTSTSIVMSWINGWSRPVRPLFRKVSRKRMMRCSLPIVVNQTIKIGKLWRRRTITFRQPRNWLFT